MIRITRSTSVFIAGLLTASALAWADTSPTGGSNTAETGMNSVATSTGTAPSTTKKHRHHKAAPSSTETGGSNTEATGMPSTTTTSQ